MDIPLPHWLTDVRESDRDAERTRFFLRLAALYASKEGHMTQLSSMVGLAPSTLGQFASRPEIKVSPATAKSIEKVTGGVVPRQELNPVFDAE